MVRGHISNLIKDVAKTEQAMDMYKLIRKQRYQKHRSRGNFIRKNSLLKP